MAVYTTIDNPELYFQCKTYTGNGSANHAITLPGDTDMQPDLVWIKNRDTTDSHCLFDSVRGATKLLSSNATTAESTDADTLDSFTSDGFQVDADVKVNTNAEDYVAWCWKESATAGFDIVSYTGNGSARTISHSLSAVPHFGLFRNRSNSSTAWNWGVYHKAITATHKLHLNDTEAKADNDTVFNDTEPTSSVFSVGTWGGTNYNTDNIIAYLFAPKQGFSKFGSLKSNNSDNGTFCYTGFSPAWVMVKSSAITDTWADWYIWDNKRKTFNLNDVYLQANDNVAEAGAGTNYAQIDMLSNGFKIRRDSNWGYGGSGVELIYMAFAEAPLVNSKGVPCNAR